MPRFFVQPEGPRPDFRLVITFLGGDSHNVDTDGNSHNPASRDWTCLDGAWARRPYPGDDFVIPFGTARTLRAGTALTVVSWGAMVERCEQAVAAAAVDAELIDLRTLSPWDREAVLASVRKTRRCLIVHEDNMTAGFGAEIAAVLAKDAFFDLDAPIERIAMPDVPSPHSPVLLDAVVPSAARLAEAMRALVAI